MGDACAAALLRRASFGAAQRGHQIAAAMNTAEARLILTTEMEKYRARTYGDLVTLIDNDQNYEVAAPSGTVYQLDIQAFWDDPRRPNANLRVMGAIDDRGPSAYAPMCDSFAIAPDGVLVGE